MSKKLGIAVVRGMGRGYRKACVHGDDEQKLGALARSIRAAGAEVSEVTIMCQLLDLLGPNDDVFEANIAALDTVVYFYRHGNDKAARHVARLCA